MKLSIEKGELTLQEGASFELAFNHPFFTDGEEQTFSFTLPATDRNLALLDFPDRLTRRKRFKTEFPAFLEHGMFQFAGTLILDSYDSEEGITCTLSLNESALYRDFQDKSIKDLLIEPASEGRLGHSVRRPRPSASAILSMYTSGTSDRFPGMTAFPVSAKAGDFDIIINEIETKDGAISWKNTSARTYSKGSDYYEVPANYAIMPFFKLWRLIDLVFSACGFPVSYNVFKEMIPYDTLTVIPACVDSLCELSGVPWRDMAPSMTVGEFITWLKDKFAAVVSCDGNNVQVRFMETQINSDPDMDLTPYALCGRSVVYPLSKRVVLDVDKSNDGAAPPAETLQEFYSTTADFPEVAVTFDTTTNPGFYYKPALGQFQRNVAGTYGYLGADSFRYDRNNSEESEEHNAADLFVRMGAFTMDGKTVVLPVIGEAAHFHTNINGDPGSSDAPLLLCWDIWDNGHHYGSVFPYSLSDLDSIVKLNNIFPLNPEGLYGQNWKSYNELILNSVPEVSVDLDLQSIRLNSLDLTTPKLLDGAKVICKSLIVEVDEEGISVAHGTFMPIAEYDDMIIDQPVVPSQQLEWTLIDTFDENMPGTSEIFVPITGAVIRLSKQQRLDSLTEIDGYKVLFYDTDGLEDYTIDDAPSYRPFMLYQEALSRTRRVVFFLRGKAGVPFEYVRLYREYFSARIKE